MLAGARAAAPLALGDLIDGVAFGAVANGLGIGLLKATLMSLSAFSGSAQYAALTVLRDHGSVAAVLLAVVALNARYIVFGAQLSPALSQGRLRRLGESQLITDSSWGLAMKRDQGRRGVLIGAGLSSLLAWSAGSAIGALAGRAVSDYRVVGIDAALPAFFLCLLLDRVRSDGGARRALLAAGGAVALAPLLPAGLPLLVVLAVALAGRRR